MKKPSAMSIGLKQEKKKSAGKQNGLLRVTRRRKTILWGHEEDKLYHSYQIYRDVKDVQENRDAVIEKRIGALVKSQEYFVRVDAYNENGITKGKVVKL